MIGFRPKLSDVEFEAVINQSASQPIAWKLVAGLQSGTATLALATVLTIGWP